MKSPVCIEFGPDCETSSRANEIIGDKISDFREVYDFTATHQIEAIFVYF